MCDDEEVVFESSDLYKHLINQGYSDFTSLSSNCFGDNTLPTNIDINCSENRFHDVNDNTHCRTRSIISVSDHNKLLNVLNSQLLFKEDIDVLETILSSTCVYKSNSKLYSYVSVGIGGLCLSLASLLRPRISYYIPFGITLLCTTFSTWNFYLHILESHENTLFASHLSLLKNLCSNIHRVFRSLKETEIISTGQVSTLNIGIAAYSRLPIGLGFHHSKELDTLPSWKTLPQVRISLMNVLIVTIKLLNEACDALRIATGTQPLVNNCVGLSESSEYKNTIKTLEDVLNINQKISLKSLQNVNDMYLAVQSEYLKWIALSIINKTGMNSTSILHQRKGLFKMISSLQLKLANMSSTLISQFRVHNISAFNKTYHQHKKQNVDSKIHNAQVEIHNISLLVLSILLRIRSLEDVLAEVSETNTQTNLNEGINKQLASLKDDLTSTVKCYDIIYSQLISENKDVPQPEEKDIEHDKGIVVEQRSKETGIVVGASDFNVNSPDEVFLAISGDNNYHQDNFIDDWLFETKPQIPKNLIEELNKTLKSRKLHFSEREKLALERQGLQDIQDSLESSSSVESEKIESTKRKPNPRKNKTKLLLNHLCSSDSENDDILTKSKRKITGDQTSYKRLDADSSSDSEKSFSDIVDSDIYPKHYNSKVDNLSLANMIAMKSQMWKKAEEENYSDS